MPQLRKLMHLFSTRCDGSFGLQSKVCGVCPCCLCPVNSFLSSTLLSSGLLNVVSHHTCVVVNPRFLPLQFRVLMVNLMDVAWTAVMSFFSHKNCDNFAAAADRDR